MFNVTRPKELKAIETCDKTFAPCQAKYHCNYAECGKRENKVTMFRKPEKWFASYMDWVWPGYAGKGVSIKRVLPFQSQISFSTGIDEDVSAAIEILQHDYLWWGITDHWVTTVCLFHCELGGEPRESELRNTRDHKIARQEDLIPWDEISTTVPRPEVVVPDIPAYVNEHYKSDVLLYDELLVIFKERSEMCGCDFEY